MKLLYLFITLVLVFSNASPVRAASNNKNLNLFEQFYQYVIQRIGNLKGSTGATGIQGLQGKIGPVGATGLIGMTGPLGETGPTGSNGLAGGLGPTGSSGAVGATGSEGQIPNPQEFTFFHGAITNDQLSPVLDTQGHKMLFITFQTWNGAGAFMLQYSDDQSAWNDQLSVGVDRETILRAYVPKGRYYRIHSGTTSCIGDVSAIIF